VYRATDDRLGRDVALKVLKPSLAHDQDRLRRFEQEARSAAALNHPNIVAIYDIGLHEGSPYIVSELLAGQTLRERLVRGPLPLREAADYALQIAQGLVAAHEKRIVHRDLKPENIFITKDGWVKILDFGIAKLTWTETSEGGSSLTMTTQTQTGTVLGTVAYMSPEQLRGKPVDHRSDIFSLGAIFYEMLTGKRAFIAETEVDTMTAVLKENPPELADLRPGAPPAFTQIVDHCLDKERDNRFQSAKDLAFAITTTQSNVPTKPTAVFRAGRSSVPRWLPWAAAAPLLALAVFLGATFRPVSGPLYQRLTFERGTVYSARFTSDGRSIVYGASWNGHPLRIFSTLPDSLLARPVDLGPAHLLALSSANEMALALHGTLGSHLTFENGMLARAPLVGGRPREILQDVRGADWSPSGELAVVHHVSTHDQLEFPIGKILYETNGWIGNLRFSPGGQEIAFIDHPARWNDSGSVCITDLTGNRKTLAAGWLTADGLAWSKNGNEIWFTAAESGSTNRNLWAVSLSSRLRKVLAVPGGLTMQDVGADGRVLVTLDNERLAMEWTGKNREDSQDLSWYDWSVAKDISPDGQWVLFEEGGEPGSSNEVIAIRNVDGSSPIRLGDGTVDSLSPDGKWAVSISKASTPQLTLLPIGPGQARQIALPGLERLQSGTHFLPDGKRIVVNGNAPGHVGRTYLVNLSSGKPEAVTPEGVYATLPSPDGKYLAGLDSADHLQKVFPVDGGSPRPVPGIDSSYALAQWSADGKALYFYRPGEVPMTVERVDIATGKMTRTRELVPADRAGVVSIAPVVSNVDASEFAYSYYQTLSVLYVISGLR